MLRYAHMLEQQLTLRGHSVRVAHPPSWVLRRTGETVPFAKWLGYIDKFLLAPRSLRRLARGADIVHICDHSNSMYLPLAGKTPSVITCHDLLAVFSAQGRFAGIHISGTGKVLQRWIASGLLKAPFVICVSHKTESDLRELAPGTSLRSTVVHNPLNWEFRPVAADETAAVLGRRQIADGRPYLLHIGNNSWYKNRPAAVRIFAALRRVMPGLTPRLLLAGKPWDAELQTAVVESGVPQDIVEMNDVSNEELRALYSGAAALLFPSREEGFGWPILEAQACGCAVITTNRPPMTEVAGDAAILVDPDDPEAAARIIAARMHELPELRQRGFANIAAFSMDRAIEGYLDAYHAAIEAQGGKTAD